MEGNEKLLPEGWVRVQSKSRPDKFYFHHKLTNTSLWKIEDIELIGQKVKLKSSKLQSPKKPAAMTITKVTNKVVKGVAAESKVIKKNIARERMEKLQKKLSDEVAAKRGKDHPVSTVPKHLKLKINRHEDSIVKNLPAKILNAQKKSIKDASEVKNVAATRMRNFKIELRKERSQTNGVNPSPGSSSSFRSKGVQMKGSETNLKLPPNSLNKYIKKYDRY